ncbi:MAG: hypothetical protein WDZ48_00880 [Pirellulales bacterium]
MDKASFGIPPEGFDALGSLCELGREKLRSIGQALDNVTLSLDVRVLAKSLSRSADVPALQVEKAIRAVLIPLNKIRCEDELSPATIIKSLDDAIREQASDDWKEQHFNEWMEIKNELPKFFEPDNIFSFLWKSYDLLTTYRAALRKVRLLSELRPVFHESTVSPRAMILTNTLVLEYFESGQTRSLHLTMDLSDLRSLSSELERATTKNMALQSESAIPILTYGG